MIGQTAVEARTTWRIDPAHTEVGFSAKHLMITTVRGRFGEVSGTIELDESDLANSGVEVKVGAASVDTGTPDRDTHLRSADFLDVEAHPWLTFRSRRVEPDREGKFRVVGDLTIRGVTREVTLGVSDEGRVIDPWGGTRASFSATTAIDRRDWNLTWNAVLETGGVLVGNEVKIALEVQAVLS
jgi:polyisoprenoid-binding protein YceI